MIKKKKMKYIIYDKFIINYNYFQEDFLTNFYPVTEHNAMHVLE